MDNGQLHGPGSQLKNNFYKADSVFGRGVEGFDDTVPRIHSVPQEITGYCGSTKGESNSNPQNYDFDTPGDEWVPWKPSDDEI
jgi:hypothetical protein